MFPSRSIQMALSSEDPYQDLLPADSVAEATQKGIGQDSSDTATGNGFESPAHGQENDEEARLVRQLHELIRSLQLRASTLPNSQLTAQFASLATSLRELTQRLPSSVYEAGDRLLESVCQLLLQLDSDDVQDPVLKEDCERCEEWCVSFLRHMCAAPPLRPQEMDDVLTELHADATLTSTLQLQVTIDALVHALRTSYADSAISEDGPGAERADALFPPARRSEVRDHGFAPASECETLDGSEASLQAAAFTRELSRASISLIWLPEAAPLLRELCMHGHDLSEAFVVALHRHALRSTSNIFDGAALGQLWRANPQLLSDAVQRALETMHERPFLAEICLLSTPRAREPAMFFDGDNDGSNGAGADLELRTHMSCGAAPGPDSACASVDRSRMDAGASAAHGRPRDAAPEETPLALSSLLNVLNGITQACMQDASLSSALHASLWRISHASASRAPLFLLRAIHVRAASRRGAPTLTARGLRWPNWLGKEHAAQLNPLLAVVCLSPGVDSLPLLHDALTHALREPRADAAARATMHGTGNGTGYGSGDETESHLPLRTRSVANAAWRLLSNAADWVFASLVALVLHAAEQAARVPDTPTDAAQTARNAHAATCTLVWLLEPSALSDGERQSELRDSLRQAVGAVTAAALTPAGTDPITKSAHATPPLAACLDGLSNSRVAHIALLLPFAAATVACSPHLWLEASLAELRQRIAQLSHRSGSVEDFAAESVDGAESGPEPSTYCDAICLSCLHQLLRFACSCVRPRPDGTQASEADKGVAKAGEALLDTRYQALTAAVLECAVQLVEQICEQRIAAAKDSVLCLQHIILATAQGGSLCKEFRSAWHACGKLSARHLMVQ